MKYIIEVYATERIPDVTREAGIFSEALSMHTDETFVVAVRQQADDGIVRTLDEWTVNDEEEDPFIEARVD